MDIFSESFDVSAALKEGGAASKQLDEALLTQLSGLKRSIDSGLKPDEFAKAKALETALTSARIIVNLCHNRAVAAK